MKKILAIAGIIFAGVAAFSVQLGIDNDAGWGPGRIALLVAGFVLAAISVVIHFAGNRISSLARKINASLDNMVSRPARITAAAFTATVVVLSAYFWFIQFDERKAGAEYEYYIELAKSFKSRKLHLETTPPPELLALENPYDYHLRRERNAENFPWDVSLYDGKFYIYWGPVPAVLITIFSREWLKNIGDFHLAFAFACGLFIYATLIITSYWRNSLRHTPAWFLGILLLTIGFATPATIMLKGAKIYEAAIFGSQFFFIGGCYWAYTAMQGGKPSVWRLVLASLHWALSVGTRVIILPAVLFCAGLTLVYIFQAFSKRSFKMLLPAMAVVSFPLIIAGLGLGWYNWARFDSIFEFGLTYQLANADYTNFQNIFSTSRISQNVNLYFTHPIKILPRFPYLTRIEYVNSNDRLAGLVYISPYFFLLIFPLLQLTRNLFSLKKIFSSDAQNNVPDHWLFHALLGSGLISLLIILSYYFVAMRFMEDFMPALMTAITIQIGREYDALREKNIRRIILTFIVVLLAGITLTASFLLAVPAEGIGFAVNALNAISKLLGLK